MTNISEDTISLWKEREMYIFERDEETGVFSSNAENIVITSEGMLHKHTMPYNIIPSYYILLHF